MYNRMKITMTRLFVLVGICGLVWAGALAASRHADAAEIKSDVPALCYQCHAQLKTSLSKQTVHAPFKQGKCMACHDMHASRNKGLLTETVNAQCLGCHEKLRERMKKESVHGALLAGACTDCHDAHGSQNAHLLVARETDLCWKCHDKLKDDFKKPVVHSPFKDGKCSSCHDPHSSSQNYQLVSAPEKVCKSCHAPQCKAGGVSITHRTKDMDCVSCHSGHTASAKGLLGPFGHSAFIGKNCEQCHRPFAAGAAITTKNDGKDLCFTCHKKDSVTYREGDVHLGAGKNPCATCHALHGSDRRSFTINESRYCATCHQPTVKRIAAMQRSFGKLRCAPVRERKCFTCHVPLHSSRPQYLKADGSEVCTGCHTAQHRVSHPIGAKVIDPRNGQGMTCLSCHSLHSAKAEFMLTADRKRQLCIQCHKKA
ncbi:MAG: cytochrome c3 family protein [Thermodesulfovibrionales bacterium]